MTVDLDRAVHRALADILDLAPPPPDDPPDPTSAQDERPGHRIAVLAAAAVLIVAAVTGVVLLRGGSSADTPTSSTPTAPTTTSAMTLPTGTVLADPMAITLDHWATGTVLLGAGPFVVFDLATLPTGWTVASGPDGSHRVSDPDPSHYTWGVTLTTADGRVAGLFAGRTGDSPSRTGGTPVTVRGRTGSVDGDRLTWSEDDGVELTVAVADASADELVDVADRLAVTTTDALPTSTPPVGDSPAAGDVVLAGTLGDVRWSVATSPADDAALSLNVADRQFASSMSTPGPGTTWTTTLVGVGADGAILYGLAPPAVDRLVVHLGSRVDVTLPVARTTRGDAVFATPLPLRSGNVVLSIDLVAADGSVLHRATPPNTPAPVAGTTSSTAPFGTDDPANPVIQDLADPARTTTGSTAPATLPPPAVDGTAVPTPITGPGGTVTVGPISLTLPAGAVADPRPQGPPPDFVIASARWTMPDLGTVTVAVQDVHPPMPAEHLLDQFDANGLAWQVYDVGPINGSIVTAITRVGDETVLLSAQAPSFDPTGVPQRQITEIARTAHPI